MSRPRPYRVVGVMDCDDVWRGTFAGVRDYNAKTLRRVVGMTITDAPICCKDLLMHKWQKQLPIGSEVGKTLGLRLRSDDYLRATRSCLHNSALDRVKLTFGGQR